MKQNLKIFVCYADKDKMLRHKLDTHLSSLKQNYQAIQWLDQDILPGREWIKEIQKYLDAAHIILLLISPDFLASDYWSRIGMQRALERHREGTAYIIPILLRYADWRTTPIGELNALPSNGEPITGWQDRDRAFQDVIAGLHRAIEELIKGQVEEKKVATNHLNDALDVQQNNSFNLKQKGLIDYIYISDAKLDKLGSQIEISEKNMIQPQSQVQSLNLILAQLQREEKIGDIKSNKPYIYGEYPMKWGIIDWRSREGFSMVFFFSAKAPLILLMTGSVHHLMGNKRLKEFSFSKGQSGADGSNLPRAMGAIKFAVEHNLAWSEGINSISDYLFVLGFVQEKLINHLRIQKLSTDFPEQKLHFVARVQKTLQRPSRQQIQKLLINGATSEQDMQEIKQMLYRAPDILMCTPLYVALADEQ